MHPWPRLLAVWFAERLFREAVRKVSMGVRLSPHLWKLLSAEDQKLYGQTIHKTTVVDLHSSPKSDIDERREQGNFANWLLLQNSQGHKIPFCWHATHKPSKATPGTPDFWVGLHGRGIWFEFKRDRSCKLSPEQDEFRLACEAQGIEHYVVYSAQQSIEVLKNSRETTAKTLTERAVARQDGLRGRTRGCGA
jgi:hypothetical protein